MVVCLRPGQEASTLPWSEWVPGPLSGLMKQPKMYTCSQTSQPLEKIQVKQNKMSQKKTIKATYKALIFKLKAK